MHFQCNNQLMKKIRTWQLCRTGTFGQDGAVITKKDLQDIQDTFVPPRPISIGHDAARGDNFPKFGDVLAIDGIYDDEKHPGEKVLVGNVVLHPELEKQFSDSSDGSGTYEGWSVTIPRRASDGKRYLHSLAICGATPPKIPGLEQLMTKASYSDGDTVEAFSFNEKIEYQEVVPMTEEEKKKMESLEAENKKLKEDAEKKAKAEEEKELSDKAAVKKSEEEKKKADETFADMQKQIQQLKENERKARLDAFSEKVKDRVPASVMGKVSALAENFASLESFEFADENGNRQSEKALDMFADIINAGFMQSGKITGNVFDPESSYSDKGKGNQNAVNWSAFDSKI